MKVQGGINKGFVDPAIQLTWLDLFLQPSVLFLNFTHLFILGCAGSVTAHGLLSIVVQGLLIAVASLVAEHKLWSSVDVSHGLRCAMACGIFLHQESNPCPHHGQVDS